MLLVVEQREPPYEGRRRSRHPASVYRVNTAASGRSSQITEVKLSAPIPASANARSAALGTLEILPLDDLHHRHARPIAASRSKMMKQRRPTEHCKAADDTEPVSCRVTMGEKKEVEALSGAFSPMIGEKPNKTAFLKVWIRTGLRVALLSEAARTALLSALANDDIDGVAEALRMKGSTEPTHRRRSVASEEHPSSTELRRLEAAQDALPAILRQNAELLRHAEIIADHIRGAPGGGVCGDARQLAAELIDVVLRFRDTQIDFLSEAYATVRARPPEDVSWRF